MSDQLHLPFFVGDEQLPSFKYLGSILSEDSEDDKETVHRTQHRVLQNKKLHPSTKVSIYQAAGVTTLQ